MKHLIRSEKSKTVEIGGGDVVLKQFNTEYILLMDDMRRQGASSADMMVETVRYGVEGDYSHDDIKSMTPDTFREVLDAVQEFNAQFLPAPEEAVEDAPEEDSGND